MTYAKLYKEQKYCNTIERKKLQKFRNLIVFVLSNNEQSRQNRNT